VYTNREYQEAGAIVKDDLSEAGLVLGQSISCLFMTILIV
jgi:hypothetical protein